MANEKSNKLTNFEKLAIGISVVGVTFFTVYGIRANRTAATMFENSDVAEIAAHNYYDDVGEWPTSDNQVSIPVEVLDVGNELADLDEDLLIEEGYIDGFSGENIDFGIVVSGPEEGLVFFNGNDGNGVDTLNGKVHYGRELNVKGRPLVEPIIPIPVRHITR